MAVALYFLLFLFFCFIEQEMSGCNLHHLKTVVKNIEDLVHKLHHQAIHLYSFIVYLLINCITQIRIYWRSSACVATNLSTILVILFNFYFRKTL